MVTTSQEHCHECGKVTWHDDGRCNECAERKREEKQKAEDERFNALTIDERINDLKSRVEYLEKGV